MSTTTASTAEFKIVKGRAPPPGHAMTTWLTMAVVFTALLPSLATLDEAATMATFTRVLYPDFMNLTTVAYVRMCIALVIWGVTLQMVAWSPGWTQETTYLTGSKLRMVPNHLVGLKTTFPFTSVSWNLLGLSFSLSAYIAMQGAQGNDNVNPWILRIALMSWEVAAPNALLVAAVIKYAIWPGVLKKGSSTQNLKSTRNIFMHNINVLFAATECALLGGLPVRWSELALAPLVGTCYVLFSWCMTMSWNKPEYGPQFIYFFFDTTLPGYQTTHALLALLMALILFFVVFCSAESLLKWFNGGLWGSLVFISVICASVMRFRD